MTGAIAVLLLASSLGGDLCIGTECRTVHFQQRGRLVVPVAPAEASRTFTFVSRDGTEGAAGRIPQGATEVSLDQASAGVAVVRVSSRHEEPLPRLNVRIASGDTVWSFPVAPKAMRHELRIHLPAGEYEVALAAEKRRVKPAGNIQVEVIADREIELPPWQSFRELQGMVRAAETGAPIAEAAVEDAEGALLTVSDDYGRFAIDDPDPSAVRQITLRAAGFGSRSIGIPRHDPEIGTVELFRGQTVNLWVEHPAAVEPIPLEIRVSDNDPETSHPLFDDTASTGERIEIRDIPPGKHRLFVSGPQPLQHYAQVIEVGPTDVDLRVSLEPAEIRGVVTYGNDVLPGAGIAVQGEGGWRANVVTDADGAFAGEMWDRGDLALIVTAPPLSLPYVMMQRAQRQSPRYVDIQIPATVLRGFVQSDGEGIAGARVDLTSLSGETRYSRSATTGKDGRFEVSGLPEGNHAVSVSAPGYLESVVELSTAASDRTRELNIALRHGTEVSVFVQDAEGRAVPRAIVAVGVAANGMRPEQTIFAGADGRARVTLEPAAVKNVFVIDSAGRFAHAILSAARERDETIVAIPPANSSLLLRVVGDDEVPVPGVGFVVRFNGALIPLTTLQMMLSIRYMGGATGADGMYALGGLSAGRYELFPWSNAQERSSILITQASRKPAVDVTLDGRTSVPVHVRIKTKTADANDRSIARVGRAPADRR